MASLHVKQNIMLAAFASGRQLEGIEAGNSLEGMLPLAGMERPVCVQLQGQRGIDI